MIGFEHPWAFALAAPWIGLWWWFRRVQRRSGEWVWANVSARFRGRLTWYTARSLRWHMVLVLAMGLLLVAAAARPGLSGRAEAVPEGGRVLLLLDASASMNASDVEGFKTRFEQARQILTALVDDLEGHQLGLATFSGVATIHLPMSPDRRLFLEALRTVEVHNYYQGTGSSLTKALDLVFHFADPEYRDLQVVLIGDGELPFAEDFSDALLALADQEIPVHTVAVGSLEGQERLIFDFKDVVAKKEKPRVLREFLTRRQDEHFQRISQATGGRFREAGSPTAELLASDIRTRPARSARVEREEARTDLSGWPLLVFLLCFLLDALWIGHHRERPAFAFDVGRLGAGAALLVLVLGAGCDSPLWWAYQENERGILQDRLGRHEAARPHYERSRGYRIRPAVPTFNLARSVTLKGDYSEAHDLYQDALKLEPELAEAHFNDGVALYRWGQAERDPRGCELERTLDLWRQAERRFTTAAEIADDDSRVARDAQANLLYVAREIGKVEELVSDPPPECAPPPPSEDASQGGGGSGGGGGATGGGGGGTGSGGGGTGQDDPRQSLGEPPPPPPSVDPPPSGSGGAADPPPSGSGGAADPPPSGSGGAADPPPSGSGGAADPPPGDPGPQPLSGPQLEQIRQELERIAGQAREEGKYHRRTGPEQFGKASWSSPESEIWW